MTAIGRAWILSKKSRTLKTSSAGAVRLGWCGIISTKSRNDFVRSESREAGALPGGAQRRHRDRLRRNSIANDRAVEEHRVLLARPQFQSDARQGSRAQCERLPGRRTAQDGRCEILSRWLFPQPRRARSGSLRAD